MSFKTCILSGSVLMLIAIAFILYVVTNPQASFPWGNSVTYVICGVYGSLMGLVWGLAFKYRPYIMDDKKKGSSEKNRGILLAIVAVLFIIIAILFAAPALFLLICKDKNVIFSDGRFTFWGSIFGGSIGGLAALIAVYFTMKYYRKKDEQAERNAIYEKQLLKISKVVDTIINRDVINYDFTLAIGFSEKLLKDIITYNELLCMLRGYFTEYGIGVLEAFQREYDDNLKSSKLRGKMLEMTEEIGWAIQRKLGVDFSQDNSDSKDKLYPTKISVIEFLNLKPELRQCAERIGHLGLYENASDLIHSDPTLSYILEIEGGGSAGLWASTIHDRAGAFSDDSDRYEKWEQFDALVKKMLIELDKYKNDEYSRIVVAGETTIVPKYCIKRSGSFMRESITVEKNEIGIQSDE